MIRLGNSNIIPKGYVKVMKGSSLVWERFLGNTISFNLLSNISPSTTYIVLTGDVYSSLKGKKIIEITLAGFGSFIDEKAYINDDYWNIFLSAPLNKFINVPSIIEEGTEITIKYK